jgi:hypothetical protein
MEKDELLSTPVYPSPVLNVRLENLCRDVPLAVWAMPTIVIARLGSNFKDAYYRDFR